MRPVFRRVIIWSFILLFIAMLEASLVILPGRLALALGAGWIFAGFRLASTLNGHWTVICLWLTGLVILMVGLHLFLRMLKPGWSWRWSMGIAGGFWLPLLFSMGLVGIAHQFVWMSASKEPIVVGPTRKYLRLRVQMNTIQHFAKQADWSEAGLQKALRETPRRGFSWEEFQMLTQTNNQGTITNLVLLDRLNVASGFMTADAVGVSTRRPIRQLDRYLKTGK